MAKRKAAKKAGKKKKRVTKRKAAKKTVKSKKGGAKRNF